MVFVLFITQSAVCCHARSAFFGIGIDKLSGLFWVDLFVWLIVDVGDWNSGWFWVPGLSGEFLEHCPQNPPGNPNHQSQFPHSTSSINFTRSRPLGKKEIQAKESRENEKRNSFLNLNRFFAFLRCFIWSRNLIHFAELCLVDLEVLGDWLGARKNSDVSKQTKVGWRAWESKQNPPNRGPQGHQ